MSDALTPESPRIASLMADLMPGDAPARPSGAAGGHPVAARKVAAFLAAINWKNAPGPAPGEASGPVPRGARMLATPTAALPLHAFLSRINWSNRPTLASIEGQVSDASTVVSVHDVMSQFVWD